MTDLNHSADLLGEILRNQITVLSDLYSCQKRMYQGVLVRDWIQIQKETAIYNTLGDVFIDLEDQRISACAALLDGADGSTDFYRITSVLPEALRSPVNSLFREMKRLLLLSKTENEVFNTYIANARKMVSGMIETVSPARRNKIYTRRGSLATPPVENLVLNRSF